LSQETMYHKVGDLHFHEQKKKIFWCWRVLGKDCTSLFGMFGMDFLKIPFERPLILVFHFEAKKKILVGIVTFHHWLVFFNLGFMCGGICSTFVKIIESKPFVITDFFFVIYKEVIGVPFSCGGLVKASSWRSLATMIGKVKVVSWPCIDINGR